MELQESNNLIHALIAEGMTPALKMMEEQYEQAKGMGDAGKTMLEEFDNPEGELGKGLKRLRDLKVDIKSVMKALNFSPQLAKDANTIFSKNPESLGGLNETDRKVISDYWIKKKMTIIELLKKSYTHEELFS